MRLPSFLLPAYLAVAGALALVQQLGGPGTSAAVLVVLPVLSGAAVIAGVRTQQLPGGWLWLAASCFCVTAGQALYAAHETSVLSSPLWSDAAFLAAYPCGFVALVRLGRLSRRRLPQVLDATVLAGALAVPLWFLVGEPAVEGTHDAHWALTLAYPLADLLLLAALSALLLGSRVRSAAECLLALSVVGVLCSDLAFAVVSADRGYVYGSLVDLGWLVQYVAWGALALSPLAARVGAGVRLHPSPAPSRRRTLVLLAVVVSTPCWSLLDQDGVARDDVVLMSVVAVVINVVLFVRLALLASLLREDAERRRREAEDAEAVTEADAVLLAAVDRADVQRAAVRAGLAVVRGDACALALALGSPELLDVVAVDTRGLDAQALAGVELDALLERARGPLARREESDHELPSGVHALVLPLYTAGRSVGALVVLGPPASLHEARTSLRHLSGQVALALTAVGLREVAERGRTVGTLVGAAPGRHPGLGSSMAPGFVAELTASIRRGELVAHYQPIVDLHDGRPRGFEALVRWEHPERGLLMPSSFLPQLEEAGLLGGVDGLLLGQACRQAVDWDRSGSGPYVSVNLSTPLLRDETTPRLVRRALFESGLQPWRLQVEVTETAALEDPAAVARVLARLRTMGVRIALDDFGTGYSALSWLQGLPLDVVKIDRSFIDLLPVADGSRPVVEAVVRLAQTLGLDVVAEGVERAEQSTALLAMGVDRAQGWLFSRALPAPQAQQLLTRLPVPRPSHDLRPSFQAS